MIGENGWMCLVVNRFILSCIFTIVASLVDDVCVCVCAYLFTWKSVSSLQFEYTRSWAVLVVVLLLEQFFLPAKPQFFCRPSPFTILCMVMMTMTEDNQWRWRSLYLLQLCQRHNQSVWWCRRKNTIDCVSKHMMMKSCMHASLAQYSLVIVSTEGTFFFFFSCCRCCFMFPRCQSLV